MNETIFEKLKNKWKNLEHIQRELADAHYTAHDLTLNTRSTARIYLLKKKERILQDIELLCDESRIACEAEWQTITLPNLADREILAEDNYEINDNIHDNDYIEETPTDDEHHELHEHHDESNEEDSDHFERRFYIDIVIVLFSIFVHSFLCK